MNSDHLQIVILNVVIVSPIDLEEASKTTASYASFFFRAPRVVAYQRVDCISSSASRSFSCMAFSV